MSARTADLWSLKQQVCHRRHNNALPWIVADNQLPYYSKSQAKLT